MRDVSISWDDDRDLGTLPPRAAPADGEVMRPSACSVRSLAVHGGAAHEGTRTLPEETAVALVYNGSTQAVMMASPADLEDFALGFSLTEGIVERLDEIEGMETAPHDLGVEMRMWLSDARAAALAQRRRFMAGPIGCGLCGIDSLSEAVRRPAPLNGGGEAMTARDVHAATEALAGWQPLHDRTRAVHAAAFFRPGAGVVLAREDVGRHNALDKLVGAMARQGVSAGDGAIVLTSRISVDMVQKSAVAGAPVIIAVSAPTAHAVRLAEAAGITLVGLARGGSFEVFSRQHGVRAEGRSDVA